MEFPIFAEFEIDVCIYNRGDSKILLNFYKIEIKGIEKYLLSIKRSFIINIHINLSVIPKTTGFKMMRNS